MSGRLYDEDGIDGPFNRGMATRMKARKPADRLVLTINIGNEAMLTVADVADALRMVSSQFESDHAAEIPIPGDTGSVHDANGNTVGTWKFIKRRA